MILGDLLLVDVVVEFCIFYLGLSVDMFLDNWFVNLVEEGFDFVIWMGYLEDLSLIVWYFLDFYWVVCILLDYIRWKGRFKVLEDLSFYNCLLYFYYIFGVREWEFMLF